jgi:hypothetical protein
LSYCLFFFARAISSRHAGISSASIISIGIVIVYRPADVSIGVAVGVNVLGVAVGADMLGVAVGADDLGVAVGSNVRKGTGIGDVSVGDGVDVAIGVGVGGDVGDGVGVAVDVGVGDGSKDLKVAMQPDQ